CSRVGHCALEERAQSSRSPRRSLKARATVKATFDLSMDCCRDNGIRCLSSVPPFCLLFSPLFFTSPLLVFFLFFLCFFVSCPLLTSSPLLFSSLFFSVLLSSPLLSSLSSL